MTITAQRLLTELGRRAWSGFNIDDMVFDSDDSFQAKAELNSALRYLINLQDFPFRSKEETIIAFRKISSYDLPEGQITSIFDAATLEPLTFIGDNSDYDKSKIGTPTHFWVDSDNPEQAIRLYPIPDKKYTYTVVFNQYKPVLGVDGNTKFEFEREDDFINLPQNLEYLFMDCLILRTMITNNKDQEDENYVPTINEFNQAWQVFKSACKPTKTEARVVW